MTREALVLDQIRDLIQDFLSAVPDIGLSSRLMRRSSDFFERFFYLDRADRLMAMARDHLLQAALNKEPLYSSALWWSGELTRAKGRMGRAWWAPRGGVYLCISLFPRLLQENIQLYTLAAGVSVAQTLRDFGLTPEIRWLNDVLLAGKKVAGILTESILVPGTKEQYLLIGIGINVNQKEIPGYLKEIATSMYLDSGKEWPLTQVGCNVAARMGVNFALLHEWEAQRLYHGDLEAEDTPGGGLRSCQNRAADTGTRHSGPDPILAQLSLAYLLKKNPIIASYEAMSRLRGRRVTYGLDLEQGQGTPCVSRGISDEGFLILEMAGGQEVRVSTGEIRFIQD